MNFSRFARARVALLSLLLLVGFAIPEAQARSPRGSKVSSVSVKKISAAKAPRIAKPRAMKIKKAKVPRAKVIRTTRQSTHVRTYLKRDGTMVTGHRRR